MESFLPEYLEAKYLKLKQLLPIWPEIIQAKPAICSSQRHCLLLFVCFGLDLFRTRLPLIFYLYSITENYRTVNGNLLDWIFSSQILKRGCPQKSNIRRPRLKNRFCSNFAQIYLIISENAIYIFLGQMLF